MTTFFSNATHPDDNTNLPVLSGYMLCDGVGHWCWVLNTIFFMKQWTFSRFGKTPDATAVEFDKRYDLKQATNLQLHRNFMGIHGSAVVAFDVESNALQLHVIGKNNVEIAMQWVSNISQRINWANENSTPKAADDPRTLHDPATEVEPKVEHDSSPELQPEPEPEVVVQLETADVREEQTAPQQQSDSASPIENESEEQAVPEPGPRTDGEVLEIPEPGIEEDSEETKTTEIDDEPPQAHRNAKAPSQPRRVSSVTSLLAHRRSGRKQQHQPTSVVYSKPKATVVKRQLQAPKSQTFDFSF